ncbi:ABC transporter ATP-binding protein [Paenibacillus aurantius]|uniref:ABC transporter ATP-binding protein n=1 Tax=Paenibacillus aurantius TaxID=2918900 RepID=A0AA96LCY5_9BACL|nr:ABC transporter ATP-binding protein [Paenibacillus aurantius]WNQ09452.1 ABC transporter ATP-binding protein [Paenibacillus aurantius]
MGYLAKYRRKYGKSFMAAIFFLTIEALGDLLQPTIMAKIIDVGVSGRDMGYVLRMGGLMLLITLIGAVGASARNIISSRVSQKFGTELRSDLFRKIQSLSFRSIDKFERASLVTRLTNDVTQVQNFVNGLMRIFVKAPLLCIGSLIMAARLEPELSLILAVVVPLVGLLIFMNMRVGFPRFLKVQKALDQVNRVMREYLSGVRVVKAFNRFNYETEKFQEANAEYQTRSVAVMRAMSIFNPAIMLTVNLGILAVIWLGGIRVDQGQMQVGSIIAFINYMTQILFSLMTISMVFNMFVRARASTARIGDVFAEENPMTWKEEAAFASAEAKGRIDFENVTFSYEGEGGEPVLKGITFSCLPGETVGLIGSTGSGKSSLVNLIPRFYDADSGTVRVNGRDLREMDPHQLRESMAVVPQKTVLFTGSIAANLKWGKEDATREQLERAAQAAEAAEFIEKLPEGYETKLGQKGVNLSGGQKQRLSIARALLREPDILILDDCTSAVDVETEARIKASLKAYSRGLTCLLIAQRITSVMDADKIVVLDNGELVGIGTHDELIKECRVYQEIYRSQIGKELHADVNA